MSKNENVLDNIDRLIQVLYIIIQILDIRKNSVSQLCEFPAFGCILPFKYHLPPILHHANKMKHGIEFIKFESEKFNNDIQ